MVRIAVCDDEEEAVEVNQRITEESLKQYGIGCEITSYTDSKNLYEDITEDNFFYDLLLLDIEMPGLSGMEFSRLIKPSLPNVKIIFITSHNEYAIDAFELAVFRYVPKMEIAKKLEKAVYDAAKLIELEAGKEYTIQTSFHFEKIPYKEIQYIQRDGKNACIVTDTGISKVRKSMQKVFEELNAEEFLYIDRGCIVNLVNIMKVVNGMVSMKSGVSLPISRSRLAEVNQKMNHYWGKHI